MGLTTMRSVPSHEYPPEGTREPSGADFARALSLPSEPQGRNSALHSNPADSSTVRPLSVGVAEIDNIELGSGTSPHGSRFSTRAAQSAGSVSSCGSSILATIPIPANITASNPGGASESGSTSAIATGLQGLCDSPTAHPQHHEVVVGFIESVGEALNQTPLSGGHGRCRL